MKELPILFSTDMVQAILDGRKTVTRRIIKPQPSSIDGFFPTKVTNRGFWLEEHIGKWIWATEEGEHFKFSPYGKPGDLLYVRETFADVPFEHHQKYHGLAYKADFGDEPVDWNWKPSIFLKKEDSRIWLRVKDVRVEKVRDIQVDEVSKEGVLIPVTEKGKPLINVTEKYQIGTYMSDTVNDWTLFEFIIAHFAKLWDSINDKRGFGWEKNPWVWVVEFEVVSTTGNPGAK